VPRGTHVARVIDEGTRVGNSQGFSVSFANFAACYGFSMSRRVADEIVFPDPGRHKIVVNGGSMQFHLSVTKGLVPFCLS
jgi:hypothetical protein